MTGDEVPRGAASRRNRLLVSSLVLAAFAAVVAGKALSGDAPTGANTVPSAEATTSTPSPTSRHNDAVDDYREALESGLPVFVLFHSLTCEPCVEISAVADRVLPAYEGKIAFVNAITGDPAGRRLASEFTFQYIPTSFFLAPGGEVVDSHTGTLSEEEMRAGLDALVGR